MQQDIGIHWEVPVREPCPMCLDKSIVMRNCLINCETLSLETIEPIYLCLNCGFEDTIIRYIRRGYIRKK